MIYNNTSKNRTKPLTIQEVLSLIINKTGYQPILYGRAFKIHCPAHDDKSPSCSISMGDDGRILMYCFSGCSFSEICNALDIKQKDLFPEKRMGASYG